MNAETDDLRSFAARMRAARERLSKAAQKSELIHDPMADVLEAQVALAEAFESGVAAMQEVVGTGARGLTPDGEDALLDRMSRAVASGTDERAATLARSHNWRTVFLAVATVIGLTAVALASGYWTGLNAGRAEQAARTTAAADIRAYLGDDLMGARQWRDLIRLNGPGIKQALAQCAPNAQPSGQPACNVLLWTGPTPGAKN